MKPLTLSFSPKVLTTRTSTFSRVLLWMAVAKWVRSHGAAVASLGTAVVEPAPRKTVLPDAGVRRVAGEQANVWMLRPPMLRESPRLRKLRLEVLIGLWSVY